MAQRSLLRQASRSMASFTLIVIYDYMKESKGIADNDKSQVSRHTGK
jgi:hypothetical protein